jgi:dihydroorotase
MVVCPGLVDIHVHFRDPGFTYKEDIRTGSEAAARGGFTTVVCMANTKPVVDNEETLKYILDECRKSKINVLQTASITKGLRGEELTDMERLKKLGAAGFTDDGIPLTDGKTVLLAMKKVRSLDMPLSLHEEDPSYIGMAGINEGEISEKLGVKGASHLAEDVMVSRDCILALSTGAKINIQHLSSGISVELIRWAKSKGANVTAEVSPHDFSMTEKDVIEHGANSKMNPPLRTEADRIKIIEGLKDDTIEIIATDHAPHSREEKEKGIEKAPSGIIGLETSLALGITNLVNKNHIELMKLIEKMTIKPARLYSLQSGFLKEGADADITIFNPVEKWIVKDFSSKSSNSPFIGQELYGKVKFTICRGNIVYRDKADI